MALGEIPIPDGLRRVNRRQKTKSLTYMSYLTEHGKDAPNWAIAAAAGLDQRLNGLERRMAVLEQRLAVVIVAIAILMKLPPGWV